MTISFAEIILNEFNYTVLIYRLFLVNFKFYIRWMIFGWTTIISFELSEIGNTGPNAQSLAPSVRIPKHRRPDPLDSSKGRLSPGRGLPGEADPSPNWNPMECLLYSFESVLNSQNDVIALRETLSMDSHYYTGIKCVTWSLLLLIKSSAPGR